METALTFVLARYIHTPLNVKVSSGEGNAIALLLHKCSDLQLHSSSARVGNGKSRARGCTVTLQLHALMRSGPPH